MSTLRDTLDTVLDIDPADFAHVLPSDLSNPTNPSPTDPSTASATTMRVSIPLDNTPTFRIRPPRPIHDSREMIDNLNSELRGQWVEKHLIVSHRIALAHLSELAVGQMLVCEAQHTNSMRVACNYHLRKHGKHFRTNLFTYKSQRFLRIVRED